MKQTLHPIRTEADYRTALAQVSKMVDAPAEPDPSRPPGQIVAREKIDASSLLVIAATAEEIAAHETFLDVLDKAAGGACVWRTVS